MGWSHIHAGIAQKHSGKEVINNIMKPIFTQTKYTLSSWQTLVNPNTFSRQSNTSALEPTRDIIWFNNAMWTIQHQYVSHLHSDYYNHITKTRKRIMVMTRLFKMERMKKHLWKHNQSRKLSSKFRLTERSILDKM